MGGVDTKPSSQHHDRSIICNGLTELSATRVLHPALSRSDCNIACPYLLPKLAPEPTFLVSTPTLHPKRDDPQITPLQSIMDRRSYHKATDLELRWIFANRIQGGMQVED